jgi:hypothetical protein
MLNISKTYGNTFFAVFQSIDYPNFPFITPEAYMYYAIEEEKDIYNLSSYAKIGALGNWNLIDNKNGLLEVNLAPIKPNPLANEINLTIFNTQLESNFYENKSFIKHDNNKFFIPISSPWFGEVNYNVTFEGTFQYKTLSKSTFRAECGQDVSWNLTLNIDNYAADSYNNSAKFNYPNFWKYVISYNDTEIYDENNVAKNSNYIELSKITNGTWTVNFNQSNNIIYVTLYSSETTSGWIEFETYMNAYHYINVSAQFNNSQGDTLLYVYPDQLDLKIEQELTGQNHTFPIWSPRYNTSMTENGTILELKIMTNNGTMAGIISKNLSVELIKIQPLLLISGEQKESYIYGDTINLMAILTTGQNTLSGENIQFTFINIYSNGATAVNTFNITTNEQGIALISYPIGEVESVKAFVSYGGNVDYKSAVLTSSASTVRSPEMQFFLNYLPYFIAAAVAIIAIISYITIKRYRFKQNMKEWRRKTDLFSDILKVDLILIIHKEIGVAIIKENFTEQQLDGDLISGFLQAITSFKYEIKKGSGEGIRESILLDYRDYKILLEDGKFIRFALVLNAEPSENLKKAQSDFIIDFENKYYKYLKEFSGEVAPFRDAMQLINKHFNMSIARPHVVNENPPPLSLNSFQQNILAVARTLQSDAGEFYISRLLNYLISAMPHEPKERIIADVFDLEKMGFLEVS